MKLVKFRVKHYKSIIDSGDCYPTDTVTILAGKNEAGKSSLLEALEDFNLSTPIRDKAIPIGQMDLKPSVEIEFSVPREELIAIIQTATADNDCKEMLIGAVQDVNRVTIRKSHPASYALHSDVFSTASESKPSNWETAFSTFNTVLSNFQLNDSARKLQLPPISINVANWSETKSRIGKYHQDNALALSALTESDRQQIQTELNSLRNAIVQHEELIKTNMTRIREAFLRRVPNFVLFSSFDDVFPSEVPFDELAANEWIQDLASISDLDVATIVGTNRNAKRQHKHQLNLQLNKDFQQFWTQDISELSVDWDSGKLDFWIQEQGKFYPPEVRSQGRRWHLAFYIRVSARARDDVANIILIDEPGLYLHATAQRDILKHLEESSQTCQILISTHSPYLIEADKLDRLRLVLKSDSKGTYIENKVHAVADKETLTPILTAIGLELNQGIAGGDKVDNVVVEGPSDYFYLTAFSEAFNGFNGKFVSGGSSGNMPKIGTILQGWGCRVIYLYDNDKAYRDARNSVKKDWLTITKDWLMALNIDGAIEDIFTKEEFAAILDIQPETIVGKNSDHMKATKRDKVLPSPLYLSKVRSGEAPNLSAETTAKVNELLGQLSQKFEAYSV